MTINRVFIAVLASFVGAIHSANAADSQPPAGTARPYIHVLKRFGATPDGFSPESGSAPGGGFGASQLQHAYGFDQITFNNGTVKGNGAGQTIAIVDAYDQPNIASDLATFDSTLGIPAPPSFSKVNQTGGTSYPSGDSGWGLEISLDVEWAHAMAPGANILLVEANSSNFSDLLAGVDYARSQPGVTVISMSFGGSEWNGENASDSHFTAPSGHSGVTFTAASGDNGSSGAPEYPSVSPNVLAVGGTSVTLDSSNNYVSETGWSGSGGGIGLYESQPSYQNGVVTQSSSKRTVPDVAYDASSNGAVGVYDTYGNSGWTEVYGTSAAAPQWAALIAIANQGRALAGQPSLNGISQTLPKLYQLPGGDFHDITSGNNGGYSAGAGYDLVTGRGSPFANLIVPALIDSVAAAPVITSATTASGTAGSAFSYTITATNSPASYNATGLPGGLSVNTATGVISGTPTTAGTTNVTISAANASGSGSATLVLTIKNSVPVITSAATAFPNPVSVNGSVSFAAAASDADGDTLTYSWSFGDGGTATGASVLHVYTATGNFTAKVTVSDGNGNTVSSSVTETVEATVVAPVITSAATATGTVGSAFSYVITASNGPTSFNATKLPAGLSVNTATGAITGTPTVTGTSNVSISAANAGGTGSATLTLTINATAQGKPVISSATTASGTVEKAFTYAILASNNPTSFNATGLPAGLSVNTSTGVISGTPPAVGTSNVLLSATNAAGTGQATLNLTIGATSRTLHVAAITMNLSATSTRESAIATVSITDGNGSPISGVKVFGYWSGLTNSGGSARTGSAGTARFTSARTRNSGTFTFTVTSVSKTGYTYDPSQNTTTSASIATTNGFLNHPHF